MHHVAGYRCTICGKEFPFAPELMTCPHCGEKGILDIVYDYEKLKKSGALTRASLEGNRDNSMWRYSPLMPLKNADFP